MAFLFFTPPTLDEVKTKVAGFAALGQLYLDSWAVGDPGEQLYIAFAQTVRVTGDWVATITRGFVSLDTSTDPGDPDDFNPGNAALDPEPGHLSEHGENNYYTIRIGATYATTIVNFTNASNTPFTFPPEFLTLARDDDATVTYTNSPDPTVYDGPGGTYTLYPGVTKGIPVTAESPGSRYSASPEQISVLVSRPSGVSVSNPGAAIARDRERADLYRARCRSQATSVSPNGAADKYRRAATTNIDGTPLLRPDGVPVSITRVHVSPQSATGSVDLYYATDSGPADATDVTTANINIVLLVASPGDCITLGPYAGPVTPDPLDPPGGEASAAVDINITWTAKYRPKIGGKNVAGADVRAAIVATLVDLQPDIPLGGFGQVAGVGKVYLEFIRGNIQTAHPAITNVVLGAPLTDTIVTVGANVRLLPDLGGSTEIAE